MEATRPNARPRIAMDKVKKAPIKFTKAPMGKTKRTLSPLPTVLENTPRELVEYATVLENTHTSPEKPCTSCGQPIYFSAFGWPDVCVQCDPMDVDDELRECSRCDEKKIPSTEPDWKTVCAECYLQGRDCNLCGQKISPSAPKFAKVCHSCFLDKRAKTHAKCTSCKGDKANHLRRLKSEPFCKDCMKNLSIFKKARA